MIDRKRITFFLDALHGGGAEKAVVNLLIGLAQRDEFDLDLVLATKEGPYLDLIPQKVRIIDLNKGRTVTATFPLINYLKKNRPWALIASMGHVNVVALIATALSQVKTRLLLVEHTSLLTAQNELKRSKLVLIMMKWLYPHANAVAAVSAGVAQDLEKQFGLGAETVKVLYNPVVNENLTIQSKADLNHPWFTANTPPVFLAVGRLNSLKDFPNLLNAFAQVRKQQEARLIILGEGEERPALEVLIQNLGIGEDVLLPGFVKNPYAYMKHASCFVLSSIQEALPTVLIEAMACGCPVVATDCPYGPEEILDCGTYGLLVPVKNSEALGKAMLQTLRNPSKQELLMQRANEYSTEKAVAAYLSLLHKLETQNIN
jgi:glycosyltransferase involved in cell wall biosynthesis